MSRKFNELVEDWLECSLCEKKRHPDKMFKNQTGGFVCTDCCWKDVEKQMNDWPKGGEIG